MTQLNYSEIAKVRNNPGRVINLVLSRVEQALGNPNQTFESLTHPFPVAIDLIASFACSGIDRIANAEANIYSYNASKPEEIYRHMADDDFWGMFGQPSSSTIRYAIPVEEIERLAVPYEESSGSVVNAYKKLCIPRDTVINVYGLKFMTLNTIEIRLMKAGHIQVVYSSTDTNPFFPLETNILERNQAIVSGHEYLYIDVPVKQLECDVKRNLNVSPSSGLKTRISFKDKLFGVRAWLYRKDLGRYFEMSIVYNNEVIDPNVLTLAITLNQDGGYYDAVIPDAYVNNGMGLGTITILTYTTKGYMQQDLDEIRYQQHTPEYLDHGFDNEQLDKYSAPILSVNNSEWKIVKAVTGGANPRSFNDLKESYRMNARRNSLPVSDNQLSFSYQEYGYELVKATDYGTGRMFKLTREIPEEISKKNPVETVGCYTGAISYSLDELKKTGVVYDNGKRVTIPPRTLVKVGDYTNTVLPKVEIDALKRLRNDEIVEYTNNNFTVFNPYHYVVDTTNDQLACRAYLLDSPEFRFQNFLFDRAQLGIELGVGSIGISLVENGYLIRLVTRSDKNYKQLLDKNLAVQLFFNPADATTQASIKGKLVGKTADEERVWEFLLETGFDIDKRDLISFQNFDMFGEPQSSVLAKLEDNIGLLFLMEGTDDGRESKSDRKIDASLFEKRMLVMAELGYRVTFGRRLKHLHTRIRPVKGSAIYEKYESDVPDTYTEDKWQYDKDGHLVFGKDNRPILEHRAGEVMVDKDGNVIYKHYKGQIVRDAEGNLVKVAPERMKFHMEFFGFDGVYYFTNDSYDTDFVNATKNYISNIVMADMAFFASKVLDLSVVVYQPKKKLGFVPVVINNQMETNMKADISFQITFYVTKSGHTSETLHTALTKSSSEIINRVLKNPTFAKSRLTDEMRKVMTDEVIDFKIMAISGGQEIDVMTNLDGTSGFGVRKILELTGDDIRSVKESIVVNFMKHFKEKAI